MRAFLGHNATGLVIALILAGAGYFGFVNNAYIGVALWALALLVVIVYGVGWIRDRRNPRFALPTEQPEPPKIQTGDIKDSRVTFGDNSPITETHIHRGELRRTFNGKPLDAMNGHIEALKKFQGTRLGLAADHGLPEPTAFANEIGIVARMAGWEIQYGPVSAHIGSTSGTPSGVVELGSAHGKPFPPELAALEEVLNAMGFATIRGDTQIHDDSPLALVWRLS